MVPRHCCRDTLLMTARCALLVASTLFLTSASRAHELVVAVTPIDAAATRLLAVDLEVERAPRALGTVDHRRGYAPVGVVIDASTIVLVVEVGNAGDALVVKKDTVTGAEVPLVDEAVPGQAPLLWSRPDGGRELLVVRLRDEEVRGGTFEVVGVDVQSGQSQVRASGQRLWVTPFHGPDAGLSPGYLVLDGAPGFQGTVSLAEAMSGGRTGDGHAHVDVVIDGIFLTRTRLGSGAFRSPTRFKERLFVEQSSSSWTRLVEVGTGKVLIEGRPGLSPAVSAGGMLAVSSSKKDGSVLVGRGDGAWRVVPGSRAGVARPRLVVDDGDDHGDDDVIVAWLDRGASLPGELWRVGNKARVLLPPTPRTVVTVLGLVPPTALGAPRAPTSPTSTTLTPWSKEAR
jgi:hypothetical protein